MPKCDFKVEAGDEEKKRVRVLSNALTIGYLAWPSRF